jgi:hypothetical protein
MLVFTVNSITHCKTYVFLVCLSSLEMEHFPCDMQAAVVLLLSCDVQL